MGQAWPVMDGTFVVGDPLSPVAVCTLTTEHLHERLAGTPGVAIAGQVYTANLGIERIVLNVAANPSIRFLLLCGKDSKVFRPGQSLGALAESGIDGERRIVGAEGYEPVLPNVPAERVETFRRQIELVDWTGEDDPRALEEQIGSLTSRNPGRFTGGEAVSIEEEPAAASPALMVIRPGGHRQPLQYDPRGYFVITVDRVEEQIVLRHYLPDHTPAHEMRGRLAESMVLGLLQEDVVSQLSHAAYLGTELARAEAALHLDLRYRQDRPLTRMETAASTGDSEGERADGAGRPAGRPAIAPALGLCDFRERPVGDTVDIVLEAAELLREGELAGAVLEPDAKAPFSAFHRTDEGVRVRWTDETRIAMGSRDDIVAGGIFRVQGPLGPGRSIDAGTIVVLSHVAEVG